MGDFFADLRSGIQFPQVVMNQGPMPGSGGLPRPLHDTVDGRINYNSSLLGNLTPYAYGEPGYLSSQTAYLNIPHKIQKFVPIVYLPEAKPGATDFFDLPHPVDDGDLVFTLRLARNSLFCTGLKHGDTRRISTGTAVDPLINLATVNYILSGVQLGISTSGGDLWSELLFNLDRRRFGKRMGMNGRDYSKDPVLLSDIVHIVRHCIRPLGIARGSEKQGGQNEATLSPATWPVGFVISVTLDGKESNVMNLWHNYNLSAGDDMVLALKLMPLRPYTLNHYYKSIKRQNWFFQGEAGTKERYVWQLVPVLANLETPTKEEEDVMNKRLRVVKPQMSKLAPYPGTSGLGLAGARREETIDGTKPWQELGFWHIGRSQIMTGRYGVEEYWHNDLANSLRTNHLDITLQPYFTLPPVARSRSKPRSVINARLGLDEEEDEPSTRLDQWRPTLALELMSAFGAGPGLLLGAAAEDDGFDHDTGALDFRREGGAEDVADEAGEKSYGGWEFGLGLPGCSGPTSGSLEEGLVSDDAAAVAAPPLDQGDPLGAECRMEDSQEDSVIPVASVAEQAIPPPEAGKKAGGGKKRAATGAGVKAVVGGSLLKSDGTLESSMVSML